MTTEIPCDMCGAESDGRVLEYEAKPETAELLEIGTICPDCAAGLVQMMHNEPPEYVGLEK